MFPLFCDLEQAYLAVDVSARKRCSNCCPSRLGPVNSQGARLRLRLRTERGPTQVAGPQPKFYEQILPLAQLNNYGLVECHTAVPDEFSNRHFVPNLSLILQKSSVNAMRYETCLCRGVPCVPHALCPGGSAGQTKGIRQLRCRAAKATYPIPETEKEPSPIDIPQVRL
jgi:hypothetical protein